MWIHVKNELIIGNAVCLFEAVHAFDDFYVYISIFCNESINVVK